MSILLEQAVPTALGDRLRDAYGVTAEFLSDIISETCRRFPSTEGSAKAARVERLIQSQAWTDAALALIDLELPQWQIRRLAYDGGEWYCSLSRQREMPDWLDEIDRDPPRRPGAGDPERVRRGPARQRAVAPDQRAERAAARRRPLRANLQR